jgi:hypothetical protein
MQPLFCPMRKIIHKGNLMMVDMDLPLFLKKDARNDGWVGGKKYFNNGEGKEVKMSFRAPHKLGQYEFRLFRDPYNQIELAGKPVDIEKCPHPAHMWILQGRYVVANQRILLPGCQLRRMIVLMVLDLFRYIMLGRMRKLVEPVLVLMIIAWVAVGQANPISVDVRYAAG